MSKFKAIHWIAIGVTLLATVLLYFAPKMGNLKKPEIAASKLNSFNIDKYLDSVKTKLDTKTQALILQQQELINSSTVDNIKSAAFDSLAEIWQINRLPLLYAFTKTLKAKSTGTQELFAEAGESCYMASRFVSPNQQSFLMAKAIECFNDALAKDTTNLNYKTSLGICYVEASTEPMKGIMLLRDVVTKDSTNLKAQMSLGLFAIQSGQNDKAIKRFNSIIAMNNNNAEAYLYLAQAYTNVGNKKLAIESLLNFKKNNTDKTVEEEIDKYINDLRTN